MCGNLCDALYLVGYSLPPTPKQLQALVLLGGFWLIMAWMLNKLYIASWYIAKQAGVPTAFRRRRLFAAAQSHFETPKPHDKRAAFADTPSAPVQINFGGSQRNASRDYYEYLVPNSLKLLLAWTSMAELDRRALDNPELFKCRFGFAPPTTIREQVIAIRRQYDFTDHQIRWLRYSGLLKITAKEAKLAPSQLIFIAGWMLLLVVSLVCSSMLFRISYPTTMIPAWKQMAGYLFICGYWTMMAWPLGKLYLEPWYVLKRAGALAAKNYPIS
ncbi:MAG: hypothetical protein BVN35_14175 [Proteobacteria bacterium ST_bin11]|nr:MAG: hypothetical protein BVN35_14175 [Proteobacteria bacterium ST_bin11]